MAASGATELVHWLCLFVILFIFAVEQGDTNKLINTLHKRELPFQRKAQNSIGRISICDPPYKGISTLHGMMQYILNCHRKRKKLRLRQFMYKSKSEKKRSTLSQRLNVVKKVLPTKENHKLSEGMGVFLHQPEIHTDRSQYLQHAAPKSSHNAREINIPFTYQDTPPSSESSSDGSNKSRQRVRRAAQDVGPTVSTRMLQISSSSESLPSAKTIVYTNSTTTAPGSLQSNSTQHFHHRHRIRNNREDARWALVCMGGLMLLLFSVILYTRMWKKRHSGWDYLYVAGSLTDEDMDGSTVTFFSFKALIKAKTQYLSEQIRKQKEKFKKLKILRAKKKGRYTKLEPIGEDLGSGSEDELYSRP